MNEADYICQRIYTGFERAGDWISLIELSCKGIVPILYNMDMGKLEIEPKNHFADANKMVGERDE